MPTQQQIDDVLTLLATYQTAKAAADAAQLIADEKTVISQRALAAWDLAVAYGESDTGTLTDLLTEFVEAESETVIAVVAVQTTSQALSDATSTMGNKLYEITHP